MLDQSLKQARITLILMKDEDNRSTREPYLLVLLQDGVFKAEEDVYSSLVLVLQRCPNDKVIVGVLVEVGHGGDAGAEAGVLVALQIDEGTAGNEAILLGQPKRKGKKNPTQKTSAASMARGKNPQRQTRCSDVQAVSPRKEARALLGPWDFLLSHVLGDGRAPHQSHICFAFLL